MISGDNSHVLPSSDRVRDLFHRGHVARSMQVARVEQMATALGIDEQAVIRQYGLPMLPPEPGEVVYLVGHSLSPADGEPVKIGYTRQSLRVRLEALQPGSIHPLFLLAFREGGRKLEREIHRRLFYAQIRADWFEMCDGVREAFLNVNHHVSGAA